MTLAGGGGGSRLRSMPSGFLEDASFNQSPSFGDVDLFASDRPLADAAARAGLDLGALSACGRDYGSAATLDLGRQDHAQYYTGYANSSLWPLLHYRIIKDLACLDKVAKRVLSRTQRLRFYLQYRGRVRLSQSDKQRVRRILKFFEGRE